MRRILTVLVLIGVGGSSLLYYYWTQANKIPDWYTQQPIQKDAENHDTDVKNEIYQTRKKVEAKITALTPQVANSKDVELQLDASELNSLIAPKIAEKASNKLGKAVKAVKTNIKDGRLESGAIVNISEIPTAQLKAGDMAALTKVIKAFPALENREIYIGIEGKPTVGDGQLKLDENSRIKLGDLSFTTSEISQRLGIPESRVKRLTDLKLKLGGLKVDDIKLTGDNALIKGSVH